MTFNDLKKKTQAVYPALLLDRLIRSRTRLKLRKTLFYILIILFILSISGDFFISENKISLFLIGYADNIRGLFFVVFVCWLIVDFYELLYLTYYFKKNEIDFEVSKIIFKTNPNDITAGFLISDLGRYSMKRLGISKVMIERFLNSRTDTLTDSEYEIISSKVGNYISLAEYGRTLIHFDLELVKFLQKHGITPTMFYETLKWTSRSVHQVRQKEMWWSKENLIRIPSIGKNWSFGKIYLLERYGHAIYIEDSYINLGDTWRVYKAQVERLESILIKNTGENVMLVVDETASGLDIVSSFARTVVSGTVHPALEHKRIFVLDPQIIMEDNPSRMEFEREFKNVLVESANAGNVIIVIPHLDSFLEDAHALGVDAFVLLSDALRTSDLQIIGLTSHAGFSSTIEPHRDIMAHFTKLNIENVDREKVIEILEDEVHRIEAHFDIFFTYPSIVAIVEGVLKFYPDELLSTKAHSMFAEIIPLARRNGKKIITAPFVQEFFENITGVLQGPLDEKEQKEMVGLEKKMHQRVVGQHFAINALAQSLRRSRTGLNNPKRPTGSFLFLGPTGVGKTETVKTLAETVFGDEEDMIRLDMSEFQGFDAVRRLIGESGESGILTLKAREKPYGVLLLDEFEKASEEIHNIFLQILDEGFFTNGKNEKVYLRNMVIVATSNAGSAEIFKMIESGATVGEDLKKTLIDILVEEDHFKPELINRFDDVIIFSPLFEKELAQVAELMIEKLNKRLVSKGIKVTVNEELRNYLVLIGMDKKFGAREMNRAIQETVERLIADGIIGGHIKNGDEIVFEVVEGELQIKESKV